MEKLNRAQNCSILGPQNLGLGGPGPLPWIRTCVFSVTYKLYNSKWNGPNTKVELYHYI